MAKILLATNFYPHLLAACLAREGHQVFFAKAYPPTALHAQKFDLIMAGQALLPAATIQARPLTAYRYHGGHALKWLALAQKMSAAVIYLSSAVVYGAQRDAHEASPLHPCEVQAQSLVASEAMVAAAQVPALILRSSEIILDEASLALAHTRSEQQDLKQNTSILQTLANAILQQTKFTLAGSDYPTPDGTALYDLLPLSTFLKAIVASVTYLGQAQANGLHPPAIFNLGTGQSTSVRQMMMMAETLAQRPMAYHLGPRPSGGYGQIGLNPHKTQTTFGVALNAISLEAALRAAFQQAALNFSSPAIARP